MPLLLIIFNTVFLIFALSMGIRIVRSATKFEWNPGDFEKQSAAKWAILKSIILIVITGMIAALLNIFFV